MRIAKGEGKRQPADVLYCRATVDLSRGEVHLAELPCADWEDVLGGIGRGFKFLRDYRVTQAYAPDSPLLVCTGVLTGTAVMTGLRTYFCAYSPLKRSRGGKPAAMWAAGSGKFGSKLKWTGVDEMVLRGRAARPTCLVVRREGEGVKISLEDASDLMGRGTHEKIMLLHERYPEAHFAVIGPGGENWENVCYGAIALSTENQLRTGEEKSRFAGRGGMGSLLGSKNVLAIVAQAPEVRGEITPALREINRTVARGEGSRKFRDPDKGGLGGTWSNCPPLFEAGILPERNFWPTGTDAPTRLFREALEPQYLIRDEACFRCGIACHKNVYERTDGQAGPFYVKMDYEPLTLLGLNLGLYDPEQVMALIKLNDHLGLDAISAGVVVGYVMEYNERHPEAPLAGGLTFGDFAGAQTLLRRIAAGEEPDLGRGVRHLAEKLGETAYAMECKGLELPAYLPETNPGYPFAIAGGHMSMRTMFLLLFEGETSLDYWEEAIVERGLYQVRDDMLGLCKFSGLEMEEAARAVAEVTGLEITGEELKQAVRRTFLRGYALERQQGFTEEDYDLPARVYEERNPNLKLPQFISREFFAELRRRVLARFDAEVAELGLP